MSEAKHTKGPWTFVPVEKPPFGVRIVAGEREILYQPAYCHSSDQKTRRDNELGVGFRREAEQAQAAIAEQDANARLMAAGPTMLAELERLRAANAELVAAAESLVVELPACDLPQTRWCSAHASKRAAPGSPCFVGQQIEDFKAAVAKAKENR